METGVINEKTGGGVVGRTINVTNIVDVKGFVRSDNIW